MPPSKRKPEQPALPEPKQGDLPPADNPADTAPLADDDAAGQDGAAADNPADTDQADGAVNTVLRADEEQQLVELVEVDQPCHTCYPHGWPEQVEGAHVSCFHGPGLRFGEVAQVTPEQAAAMGFEV